MQTGFCGLGCPVNAKRSMLVTMIPDAIDAGAKLVFRARVDRFESKGNAIASLTATLLDAEGIVPTGKKLTVKAKRFIASGGAINSPALLLRSGIDDGGRVGTRTFLHPVIGSGGIYEEDIDSFHGAPQSAASHHFAHRGDEVGFFMEAAPYYPSLAAGAFPAFGSEHVALEAKIEEHRAAHRARDRRLPRRRPRRPRHASPVGRCRSSIIRSRRGSGTCFASRRKDSPRFSSRAAQKKSRRSTIPSCG